MAKYTEEEVCKAEGRLREVFSRRQKGKRPTVYAIVKRVPQSGETCRIEFYALVPGELVRISHPIAALLGLDVPELGVHVDGDGMGMAFYILNCVARKLWGLSGNTFRIEVL